MGSTPIGVTKMSKYLVNLSKLPDDVTIKSLFGDKTISPDEVIERIWQMMVKHELLEKVESDSKED